MQLDPTEAQKAKVLLLEGTQEQFFQTAKAVGMVEQDLPETQENYTLLKGVVEVLGGLFGTLKDSLVNAVNTSTPEQLADILAKGGQITREELGPELIALNREISNCLNEFNKRFRNRDTTSVSISEVLRQVHFDHPDHPRYINRVGELMAMGRWPLALL